MPENTAQALPVNLLILAQAGRLEAQALLFAASLRRIRHSRPLTLYVAEPQPGPLWGNNPRMSADTRAMLSALGAQHVPFDSRHFGATYPQGNKIEALLALPPDQPFLFFDTDTLVLDDLGRVPFDFERPSASLRCEGTWPKPELYGPSHAAIWRSLYDRFDLDFDSSLDLSQPENHWRRYSYFNAGFYYFSCPHRFGRRFLDMAKSIRDAPPGALTGQALYPWLDQITLPLVIHSFGGGPNALPPNLIDGDVTCHWRKLPLLYAREPENVVNLLTQLTADDALKPLFKRDAAFRRFVYQGAGLRARAMFDQHDLPKREQKIRNQLRQAGLWERSDS